MKIVYFLLLLPRAVLGLTGGPSGGPNGVSYSFTDSNEGDGHAVYNFVDISGGTPLLNQDDGYTTITFGGSGCPFYGVTYADAWISTNGFINFGTGAASTGSDTGNDCPLPSTDLPVNTARMSVMHDDIVTAVYHEYYSTCPHTAEASGCQVVQWKGTHYSSSVPVDFQAFLYDNGAMLFQYAPGNTEQGSGSTTGIEGLYDGTPGNNYPLMYSTCQTVHITDNLAILWSPSGTFGAGARGDPYFKDWSGRQYDFMGKCDLVLLSQPSFHGVGLDIHVRTSIRKNYSFISTSAVRIGLDILEVHSYGVAFINGEQVDNDHLPEEFAGFPLRYRHPRKDMHEYAIDISPGRRNRRRIIVKTVKDFGEVNIHDARKSDFGNSTGLLGEFKTGTHFARDGVAVLEDPYHFGQEWQVRQTEPKLFRDKSRFPQHPKNQCILPEDPLVVHPSLLTHRRLGELTALETEAKKACARAFGEDREICIADVLRTGEVAIAEMYIEDAEAYAY